ncbi:type II toxin-antitoxin system HipA family toxin [Brevundimonas bacteroides]|uniref:type II toxin-antitoxin system HipA family toxin n=1 Tax=Brevundimonas bacteroides TaxID=74311 RepID=UPI0004968CA9|nr:type II toxin-antitoxin system HipA family toxin [Brevundimonas bacteroides]
MRLALGVPLSVSLAWSPSTRLPVARLAMADGLAQLEWSREVISTGLPVAALDTYPPTPGLHAARTRAFDGLHGFLADSLPDGWGQLLMRRRLARAEVDITTLTPLDRLALVGDQGRGALVFRPATTPQDPVETLDLDDLAAATMTVLEGEAPALADTLTRLGGGSGGARPKVHIGFDAAGEVAIGDGEAPAGFEPWIVKFRAPDDPDDIGPIEAAYADMAAAAGIVMSPHRLIPARKGHPYFATRRFDRPSGGGRLHMVSLAGAVEAPWDRPSASYDTYLRATRAITRQAGDVDQAFRRMLFNVLACNRDDHTRQHAYLMDAAGDWTLAPAYDLTHSTGPGGEHYLDIEGEGRRPGRGHVLALGARHGIGAKSVHAMIDDVSAAVSDWTVFAVASGVTTASQARIAKAMARVRADFEGR